MAWMGRTWLAGSAVLMLVTTPLSGSTPLPGGPVPGPETTAAWDRYVAAVETRIAAVPRALTPGGALTPGRGLAPGDDAFLAVFDTRADRAARLAALRRGDVLVEAVDESAATASDLDVPDATVQHWRGAVFVPGATLAGVLDALEWDTPGAGQPDVLAGRVLARTADELRVFLRVQRRKLLTVVYDTEHRVVFRRLDRGHATSTSVATRIREVAGAGTPAEHELAPGEDHGFLWRWRAYWRYQQVDAGVLVECESLTLSREVPLLVRPFAGRIVRSAAREAMTDTLAGLRRHLAPASD